MTELQNLINFLNIIKLKTLDLEFNLNDSMDIIDESGNKVGLINKIGEKLYLEANTSYGLLKAYCEKIINPKQSFFRPNTNPDTTLIDFSFIDKKINGIYKNTIIGNSCELVINACGDGIKVYINKDDSIFGFNSNKKSGIEEFSIKEDGKIIYCVANGIYDGITRSFPFLSTVTINKVFGFEKKIKVKTIITDRDYPIYNKENVYSYDELLEGELDVLSTTNSDILWRIEYLRQLIGEELFNRIASSCLTNISEEEYKKLFEKRRIDIKYELSEQIKENDLTPSFNLTLAKKKNKKSS